MRLRAAPNPGSSSNPSASKRWSNAWSLPCSNVKNVAKGRSNSKAIDESKAIQLIESLQGDPLECPTLLALMTGLRRGELLGLQWSDVDLESGTLHVNRSLEIAGSELRFKDPKTDKSRRTAALPSQAIAALKRHRAAQLEWMMRHRDIWADNDLVFPWADGAPWHPKRFSAAFFRRMKHLGVDISFHGLRHSYASVLLRSGVPLKVVSEALGHANISITADTYVHLLGQEQREAADRLGMVFDAARLAKGT